MAGKEPSVPSHSRVSPPSTPRASGANDVEATANQAIHQAKKETPERIHGPSLQPGSQAGRLSHY